jgi:hypothetical protein
MGHRDLCNRQFSYPPSVVTILTFNKGHTFEQNALLRLEPNSPLLRPRIPAIRNLHCPSAALLVPDPRHTSGHTLSDVTCMV